MKKLFRFSFKKFLILSMFSIFSFFLIFNFIAFYNLIYKNLKSKVFDENKKTAEVLTEFLEEEVSLVKSKAKLVIRDDEIFYARVAGVDVAMTKYRNKKNVPYFDKMNKLKYIKLLGRISNRINLNYTRGDFGFEIQLLDEHYQSIAKSSAIKDHFLINGDEEFLVVQNNNPLNFFENIGFFELKKNEVIIRAIDKLYHFNKVISAVSVISKVNRDFLEKYKRRIGREIFLLNDNSIIMSTIEGIKIKKINFNKKDINEPIEINLENKKMIVNIVPLIGSKNKVVGYMGVGVYLDEFEKLFKSYINRILIIGIIFSFLLFIIIAVILKILFLPFNKITNGLSEISNGNYESKIQLNTEGELKLIADSINKLSSEVEIREKDLKEKNEKLAKHDKLKDEFLANTSHELRTPLNGIIGITESLINGIEGRLSDAVRYNLKLIMSSGKRLSNLINDILDFSKLKNQELSLDIKPVDIFQITQYVILLLSPLTKDKNISIKNNIPEDFKLVLGDENRIQQIMNNLIGNAIKFTDDGSIQIFAEVINNKCYVNIKDTGIGIPKSKYENIFKSFEQIDGTSNRSYSGTGLGLSITKKLVELQNGTIFVSSEVGVGSTFTFSLDISEIKSDNIVRKSLLENIDLDIDEYEEEKKVIDKSIKQGKILIVDDEPINLNVLQNYLLLKQYEIVKASNGKKALEIIKEKNKEFDLIILDVMMPKMNGYEVCKIIRNDLSLYSLPILMLTAKVRAEDVVNGLEAGANDYLTKPIEKKELYARVNTLISLKNAVKNALKYEEEKQQRFITEKLIAITKDLSSTFALKEIFIIVLRSLLEFFKYKKSYAIVFKDNKYDEILEIDGNGEININEKSFDYSNDVVKELINKKSPIFVKELKNDNDLRENCLISPIIYRDVVEGFLVVEFYDENDFKGEQEKIVFTISGQAAFALENLKNYKKNLEKHNLSTMIKLSKAIVHELRTPISGIRGFASLTNSKVKKINRLVGKDDGVESESNNIKKYMEKIIKETYRVNEMAEDLIEYSSLDNSNYNIKLIEVISIIEEVIKDAEKELEINNIEIIKKYKNKIYIEHDKEKLKKCFKYLLKNCIEGADLIKSNKRIVIEIFDTVEIIKIVFEDNGVGISEEIMHNIYKPLVSTKTQGTGLGLSIVKGILDKTSGILEITSKRNEYTNVRLILRKVLSDV